MLLWVGQDLGLVPTSRAITEPPTCIEPGATAQEAVQALASGDVSHLLVARVPGEAPQGVVSDADLIALCADG